MAWEFTWEHVQIRNFLGGGPPHPPPQWEGETPSHTLPRGGLWPPHMTAKGGHKLHSLLWFLHSLYVHSWLNLCLWIVHIVRLCQLCLFIRRRNYIWVQVFSIQSLPVVLTRSHLVCMTHYQCSDGRSLSFLFPFSSQKRIIHYQAMKLWNYKIPDSIFWSPGVKNHLSWCPGQVEFQAGQAHIFTQCPTDK